MSDFLHRPNVIVDNCSSTSNTNYMLDGDLISNVVLVLSAADIPHDKQITNAILQFCKRNKGVNFKGMYDDIIFLVRLFISLHTYLSIIKQVVILKHLFTIQQMAKDI